jgi:cytochrome c oxidase assembly protein subunit 15
MLSSIPSSTLRPSLALGLALGLVLWCLWFITHLPWLALPEQTSLPIILGGWFAFAFTLGWRLGAHSPVMALVSGLLAGLAGLPALGTKLKDAADNGTGAALHLKPSAPLIVLGFLALSILVVGPALFLGGRSRGPRTTHALDSYDDSARWNSFLARVAVASILPLLLIGGLVTSTASGMAVPDWPNTFGSNMFLYPIGPRAAPDVFLEHSHRLFGTLAGLTTLLLMLSVLHSSAIRWCKGWAIALFLLIVVQGLLGGFRVREGNVIHTLDDKFYRTIHGVLAQFIFAGAVALAAYMSSSFRLSPPSLPDARKLRALATGALHVLFLQLIFGAMYRHTRSPHALWSHVAFSMIVTVAVALAGMMAAGIKHDHPQSTIIRRTGIWAIASLVLQFSLGWIVFLVGGKDLQPASLGQALLRSAHQANGAALLGLVTCLAVFARRLPKITANA